MIVFTIGYSPYAFKPTGFLAELKKYDVTMLIDVRSKPYSKWAFAFNREVLKQFLESNGVKYVWKGKELGYLNGKRSSFREGIRFLIEAAKAETIVLMCAEANPENCHRGTIITPCLEKAGLKVQHITQNTL